MLQKKIATAFLLGATLLLQGDLLDDKISNILTQEIYDANKNIINDTFINKNPYLRNNTIDYNKLIRTLKSKSLIEFSVPEQSEVKIVFHIKNGDKKGFKILKNTLSNIGYSYYLTDFIKNSNNEIVWQIKFTSDFPFDPYSFNDELTKFKTEITDINRITLTNWEYTIDAQNGMLADIKNVYIDEKISLPMPLEPYYLSLPQAKELLIASSQGNNWVPKISFYDNGLNPLGTIEMNKVFEGLKVSIPSNTKYVKITDRYSLLNIKRGLSILVSNSLQN